MAVRRPAKPATKRAARKRIPKVDASVPTGWEAVPEPAAAGVPPSAVPSVLPSAADANQWSMFCHLAAFAQFIGIPFGSIVGPLVVWLIKRKEIPQVDQHGKESINFQITMTLVTFLAAIFLVLFVVGSIGGDPLRYDDLPTVSILPVILGVVALVAFDFVMVVLGAIRASNGEAWRYPLSIRFIR